MRAQIRSVFFFYLLPLALCLFPSPLFSSALSTLAASLKAGEWKELATNNIDSTLMNTGGSSGFIFGYSETMRWDPVTRRAYYIGSDHGGTFNDVSYRFVCYDENTNAWIHLLQPPWSVSPPGAYYDAHGYDKTAINPAKRRLYRNPYNNKNIYVYDLDAHTWGTLPTPPNMGASCCDGIDYFPDFGGLVWSQGTGALLFFNENSQQWSNLGSVVPLASTWMFAEYNPVHKVMVLGSSTKAFRKLSATGQMTPLNDMPVPVYDGGAWNGIVTVDPVGGDYLVFSATERVFHIYDVTNDSWKQSPNQPAPSLRDGGVAVTPVGTYGVTMFTHCVRGTGCRVSVYKHSAGGGTGAEAGTGSPKTIALTSSPNPFRGSVTLRLPEEVNSEGTGFAIYNLQGKKVAAQISARENAFHWDAGALPAGVYVAQVSAAGKTVRQRLILMK